MKRYEFDVMDGIVVPYESESGRFVYVGEHQAVRRRLLAKLCEARAEKLHLERMYQRFGEREAIAARTEAWLNRMAMALRVVHHSPLPYFRRLGEDK